MRFLLLCLVRLLAALALTGLTGCVSVDLEGVFRPEVREHVVEQATQSTSNKILLLDLTGIISSDGLVGLPFVSESTPDLVKLALNRAERDSHVRAVVLRLDSPGGGVGATDSVYHELVAFKQRTGLPVLAAINGLGCSGGYYVACAADRIYVCPTGVVGSIGVIARFPRLRGLADKIGYDEVVLKTGAMKDLANPLRDMAPAERDVLQGLIDAMYARFLAVVVAGRSGQFPTVDALRPLADGRVFTPEQARAAGLVDGIAHLPDVIAAARTAAGIPAAHVITYAGGRGTDANIYSRGAPGLSPQVNLVNVDLAAGLPRAGYGFHYLWLPVTP